MNYENNVTSWLHSTCTKIPVKKKITLEASVELVEETCVWPGVGACGSLSAHPFFFGADSAGALAV